MAQKTRLALIFGGQSAEHAVSLESAKNVADALDPNRYEVFLIGIDRTGTWRLTDRDFLKQTDVTRPVDLQNLDTSVFLVPGKSGAEILDLKNGTSLTHVDVVFPILHGPYGEDGTMQGYLRLLGVPYVGAGVLGSAVGMDKDVMKRLLRDAGIPIAKYVALERHNWSADDFARLQSELGLPFFIKPANMGSSVGVHKITSKEDFESGMTDAFQYDFKVLAEEFVVAREVECSVLGNTRPEAAVPGEILPKHDFYSYEAKYLDENGAGLQIPADLPEALREKVRQDAIRTYQVLCCEGMARVDFFLKKDGTLLVNEINTIPGFTKISMYPKMWNQAGLGYSALIDRLVDLAFERKRAEDSLVKVPGS